MSDEGLVAIPAGDVELAGNLIVPPNARGIVVFAHGSGSSRFSSRNRAVASALREGGMGTLLLDLLTAREEQIDERTRELRFDITLLAQRLVATATWLGTESPIGYFGASTGGGAALVAAAEVPDRIAAVVSRGGRPDLAGDTLPQVKAPTLLLVGSLDIPVIRMNQDAYEQMTCERELKIIQGATHLFEEPGTLEQVAAYARGWFGKYF